MTMNSTILLATCLATALCSCSTPPSVSASLKAESAPLSTFVEHRAEMKPQRERAPFALVWVNSSLPARRAAYDSIYVAPVNTRYLRAARNNISRAASIEKKDRPVRELAQQIQQSFKEAFIQSPAPRLKLAHAPIDNGVTLEIALVELNATDAAGNALKSAIPYGSVLSPLMNGNIAIEGQVRDNRTGELLFEFADNERDPMTLVSLRDYKPFEHAKAAIKDWAAQFEELTRTPPSHKVEDSLFFTLNPL